MRGLSERVYIVCDVGEGCDEKKVLKKKKAGNKFMKINWLVGKKRAFYIGTQFYSVTFISLLLLPLLLLTHR